MDKLNTKLLSYDQEKKLTKVELINYYDSLREYYINASIDVKMEIFKEKIHPTLLNIMKKTIGKELVVVNRERLDGIAQVIYAVNHTNVHDVPAVSNFIQNRFHILAGDEVKSDINGLLFRLNGVTWVDRTDSRNMALAKEEVIRKMLQYKIDYLFFPEATWNCSENLIMLPLHWGIIEVAKIVGAYIVPITIDYGDKEYYANMGKPMYFSIFDDKQESIIKLRDTMASLRFETWLKYSLDTRDNVSAESFQKDVIQKSLNEYKKLDVAYEQQTIYRPKGIVTEEEAFEKVLNLTPNHRNAFFTKNLVDLRR